MHDLQAQQVIGMQHCSVCQLGLKLIASALLQKMLVTSTAAVADSTVVLLLTHAWRHTHVRPSTLLHLITFMSFCTGYEEEEVDYGYPSHMRQASLELNVTEVASPRGSSGKTSGPTLFYTLVYKSVHTLTCQTLQ